MHTLIITNFSSLKSPQGGDSSSSNSQVPEVEANNEEYNDKNFKSQDGCGRKGAGSIRIVGGTQIRKHEYPWLCSLRRRGGHICGITLLSVYPRKTILVGAAHCYNPKSKNSILSKFEVNTPGIQSYIYISVQLK